MALITYIVKGMRVTQPSGKVATDNPDRVFTVNGTFHNSEVDPKTNLPRIKGNPLSYSTKYLDSADVLAEGFVLDRANGILTMVAGERGRKANESLEDDAIAAAIAAARAAATTE